MESETPRELLAHTSESEEDSDEDDDLQPYQYWLDVCESEGGGVKQFGSILTNVLSLVVFLSVYELSWVSVDFQWSTLCLLPWWVFSLRAIYIHVKYRKLSRIHHFSEYAGMIIYVTDAAAHGIRGAPIRVRKMVGPWLAHDAGLLNGQWEDCMQIRNVWAHRGKSASVIAFQDMKRKWGLRNYPVGSILIVLSFFGMCAIINTRLLHSSSDVFFLVRALSWSVIYPSITNLVFDAITCLRELADVVSCFTALFNSRASEALGDDKFHLHGNALLQVDGSVEIEPVSLRLVRDECQQNRCIGTESFRCDDKFRVVNACLHSWLDLHEYMRTRGKLISLYIEKTLVLSSMIVFGNVSVFLYHALVNVLGRVKSNDDEILYTFNPTTSDTAFLMFTAWHSVVFGIATFVLVMSCATLNDKFGDFAGYFGSQYFEFLRRSSQHARTKDDLAVVQHISSLMASTLDMLKTTPPPIELLGISITTTNVGRGITVALGAVFALISFEFVPRFQENQFKSWPDRPPHLRQFDLLRSGNELHFHKIEAILEQLVNTSSTFGR